VELSAVALSDGPYSGRPGTSLQLLNLPHCSFSLTLLAAYGSGSNSGGAPSQPSYPQTPPVPITWNPGSSNLPAPPDLDATQSPLSTGSNDFPLTLSNPTDGGSVTSPAHVVVSLIVFGHDLELVLARRHPDIWVSIELGKVK
jgi:hypothetical protein